MENNTVVRMMNIFTLFLKYLGTLYEDESAVQILIFALELCVRVQSTHTWCFDSNKCFHDLCFYKYTSVKLAKNIKR